MTTTTARGLPQQGLKPDEIWAEMEQAQQADVDWGAGKLQGIVYAVGDDVKEIGETAYRRYYATNPLSPAYFPSLQRYMQDIIEITGNLFHLNNPAGTVTTGGTESNLLAVLTARERARVERPEVENPAIIVPHSAHPSFNKAGHLFNVKVVRVPLGGDLRADPEAMAAAITSNTVLLVGSAPDYPHGLVDPIEELGEIALAHQLPLHVDSCVGGYFLPFLKQNGRAVPSWDFRVPGVTSISADLHKHGYSAKGASVLMQRDAASVDLHTFDFDDWPGGRYRTATISGTRAGGSIAAAWAVLHYLGQDGYCEIVRKTMRVTDRLIDGIVETPGLEVWGEPVMNKFGYGSSALDIRAIARGMEERGWTVGLQSEPPAINMHVMPVHGQIIASYIDDLREVTHLVTRGDLDADDREAAYN
jgi:sphinganine-1-phosphate aldolase